MHPVPNRMMLVSAPPHHGAIWPAVRARHLACSRDTRPRTPAHARARAHARAVAHAQARTQVTRATRTSHAPLAVAFARIGRRRSPVRAPWRPPSCRAAWRT
eukprot:1719927-Pleurochrysis_carterae.AAC.1